MKAQTLATIIGIAVIIAFLLSLVLYTYNKINRDYALYLKNRASLLNSSAIGDPVDGQDGEDGKSAYEIYKEVNNLPNLSYTDYLALFEGVDGVNGMDAPPAIDGEHGDNGSTGNLGDTGNNGSKGKAGSKGLKGLEGDSFLTVYVSSNPADDIAQDTNTNDAPVDHPSVEFIVTTSTTGQIRYFYEKFLLTTISIDSWGKIPNNENGYVSFIIYENDVIIGLTSPVTLEEYDPDSFVNFTITETRVLKYRAILSLNRSLTLSSFTSNIIEKNLQDKDFSYVRNPDPDPFVQGFYNIIQAQPALYASNVDFLEKSYISIEEQSQISPIKLGP